TLCTLLLCVLSATDSLNTEPTPLRPRKPCNESWLQWEMEVCGDEFKRDMSHIDPQYWCNLTYFISEYHLFTHCTETKSFIAYCYWPNPIVESYIVRIHKHFFSNCTIEQVVLLDPPDDTLTILILIPVFLTLAMIALVNREVFKYFSDLINQCNQQDPKTILKTVNPREAELLDAAAGVFIRFRLGGTTFPPNIYYKIFTHRPITDICANSPKNYTQEGLKRPVAQQTNNGWPLIREDHSGWYQRMENNNWRLFCSKMAHVSEPVEIGANKKMDFHHSRLQRQQDVEKWKKKRKIEWLKQLYNRGRLQTHPEQLIAAMVENSAQQVKDAIKEKGDDEILEWELDDLLAWTSTLSFEE
ncbi:protein C11orf65, partial [Nibea albiflora]